MSARETRISRRLVVAGGAAFGLGVLNAPAFSQTPEKITYLFPAPPVLPAFGPIQLAQGKGYFTEAGLRSASPSGVAASMSRNRSAPATRRSAASWRTDRSWCGATGCR